MGVRDVLSKSGGKGGKKGGSTRNIPKSLRWIPGGDDTLTVRFLTGTDEWVSYNEGWEQGPDGKNYSVVVDEDQREQWFEDHNRWPALRFLASAVDVDNNEPVVIQIPLTLAEQFVEKEDLLASKKRGDLTDYDYEVFKRGSGTDTKYFAEVVPGSGPLDLSQYEQIAVNPWDVLEQLKGRGKPEAENEPDIDDDDTPVDEPEVVAPKTKFKFKKQA